jgi:hypothetical protein
LLCGQRNGFRHVGAAFRCHGHDLFFVWLERLCALVERRNNNFGRCDVGKSERDPFETSHALLANERTVQRSPG